MSDSASHCADEFTGPPTQVLGAASGAPAALQQLAAQLAADLADAWRRGEHRRVEQILEAHPELASDRDAVLKLICEEVCLRQESGLTLDATELVERFPQWRREVESLLECRRLIEPGLQVDPALETSDPMAARTLGDFALLSELGQGAQGRVYLARQRSLGDRPVVLKVTTCHGREHLSLARLQHTHIVPLYWAQDDPENDRRILCMPYFGSVTLAGLLAALKDRPVQLRTGQHILDVLDRAQQKIVVPLPGSGPARPYLARATYARAACWIGACLADALQYAHERKLVHLDLKPSNVLLAGDGQPMLLDFHLAREEIVPGGAPPRGLGGTPLYMSPEQREVLSAVVSGKPVPRALDRRSDIFSLGLMLYQLLGGKVPLPSPPPRLETINPEVSIGLADIVHKCLAADPKDRYQEAAALADDLRRHLDNQKLRGVPNRSWHERWHKWRRRQLHALLVWLLCVGVTVVGASAALLVWQQRQDQYRERIVQIERFFTDAAGRLKERNFAGALQHAERGIELAAATTGADEQLDKLSRLRTEAQRGQLAGQLHDLAERIRAKAGAIEAPVFQELQEADKGCQALWAVRTKLIALGDAVTDPEERRHLRQDLVDVGVLGADLHVRVARGGEGESARRQALQILAETEALVGDSAVLWRQRGELLRALGQQADADAAEQEAQLHAPQSAWDHYAMGRFFFIGGKTNEASEWFARAVRREPGNFWANFYQGVCAFRQEQFTEAVSAFRVCLALSPTFAQAYHNRGLAYVNVGQPDEAVADFTRALQLEPALHRALYQRGRVQLQQKRFAEAIADLRAALAKDVEPAGCHVHLALSYRAQGERGTALDHVRRALQIQPNYPGARELLAELQ